MKRFFVLLSALTVLLVADNACLGAVTFTITPSAISNTYAGPVTLQVTGLTNTETVVVQKFLDANTNGIVDAPDFLVQQFDLTDGSAGMVIGGVTNFNVPGDNDGAVNGQITATLNFPNYDFNQSAIGKYLFKVSSPVGYFSPITNSFSITNFPFAQTISGNVVSNGTSVVVTNAVVLLFGPPRAGHDGPGMPLAEVVANNSGSYSIKLPPGTYVPVAFGSNYVTDFSTAPQLTLSSSQTINTNLTMTIATAKISGTMVDANDNSIKLPGVFMPASDNSGLIGVGFSDTNGKFSIGVTSGTWGIGSSDEGLGVHGYVGFNNNTNVNAGDTGVTLAFSKATALFYGTVKDGAGNPLSGIDVNASDQNNYTYSADADSNTNGNYVVGVLGGLGSSDEWNLNVSSDSSPTNYIFSQQNENVDVNTNQAVQQNFTAILATNHISGNVQFNGTNVVGVQVYASTTIGTNSYQSQADTDANGNYSLNVANGTWNVNVYDCGCDDNDSLSTVLNGQNYSDPDSQNVTNVNNNQTANFTVPTCNGVQIVTTSPLPNGTNGIYYSTQFDASSCSGNFTWSVDDPTNLPPGLTLYSGGAFNGTPSANGTFNFSVHVVDGNNNATSQSFSLYIAPGSSPLQITTSSLPEGTNTLFYSQTLQASGGTMPYSWSIADYSALPSNLTLATNGVLSGTLSDTADTYYFDVIVADNAANSSTQTLSLTVVNPPLPPLTITNVSLPNGNIGAAYSAQLGATGGQSPYSWSYALGSQNLSAIGLSLNSNGLISGTPTTNRVFSFKVQVTDSSVYFATTNKILSITINSKPIFSSPGWLTNRFSARLTGAANQNYTLQMSTNLAMTNWTLLFVTNNATTNSFLIADPNATNKDRFYRVLIGP